MASQYNSAFTKELAGPSDAADVPAKYLGADPVEANQEDVPAQHKAALVPMRGTVVIKQVSAGRSGLHLKLIWLYVSKPFHISPAHMPRIFASQTYHPHHLTGRAVLLVCMLSTML